MKKITILVTCLIVSALLIGCSAPVAKEISHGTVSENVYTNEFAGFTFTAPEGWDFTSDEELAKMMNVDAQALSDSQSKLSDKLLEMKEFYDMLAVNSTTNSSILVMYENLALSADATDYTEEKYIKDVKSILADTQTFSFDISDITQEKVGKQTYKTFTATVAEAGITQHYYIRKIDTFMLCILVTVAGDDEITSIMKNFA